MTEPTIETGQAIARWQAIAALLGGLVTGGGVGSITTGATQQAVENNTTLLAEVRAEVAKLRQQLVDSSAELVYRPEFRELETRVRELERGGK